MAPRGGVEPEGPARVIRTRRDSSPKGSTRRDSKRVPFFRAALSFPSLRVLRGAQKVGGRRPAGNGWSAGARVRHTAAVSRAERLVTGLLLLAFLAKLGFDLWALDRGFEMGDEGAFLLNLNHPEGAFPPFEFYRLLGAVAGGPWIGVAGARALRLAAELLGSLALVAGVFAWARRRVLPREVRFVPFLALALLGTLLHVASRSFGYNDATNLCVYGALGCVFALAGRDAGGRTPLLAAGAGLLLGLQLWIKFPTAILWVGVLAGALGVGFRWLPGRERARLVGVFAASFAAGALLVVLGTGGIGPLLARLEIAAQIPALSGYRPLEILARYLRFDLGTALHVLLFAGGFAAVAGLASRFARLSLDVALCAGLGVASAITFVSAERSHPFFHHPSLMDLAALAVGLSLLLALRVLARERRAEVAVPLAILLVAPWLQIAGTNVTLTLRLPSHVLPLFVVLGVALLDLRARAGCVRLHALFAVLAVALTGWLFVHHRALEPYGLRSAMHEQTQGVESLGVRVDLATRSFLRKVEQAFAEAGFRPGDPVLALDYMPGLVYFLGARSPGYNVYLFDTPRLNCFSLDHAGLERPPFLVLGRAMTDAQGECLDAFAFPADFELARSFVFPYEEVYRGFGGYGMSHVHIYVPAEATPGRGPAASATRSTDGS